MNWYRRAQLAETNPHGNFAGKIFYHGTSTEGAADIRQNGISMEKSNKGYFGVGFYMAEDFDLAKSNYADVAEDDKEGVVLGFVIKPEARILDLRTSNDFDTYQVVSRTGTLIRHPNFDQIMIEQGFDGLYDNSFGGIVIFNPDAIYLVNR